MAETQEVVIKTPESTSYATVIRAMTTAANACKRINDERMLGHVLTIHEWATRRFNETIRQ